MMINKESSVPMYEQIVRILKEEIASEKYPQGSSIGTHDELAEKFGVSLITVRRAVSILQKEDLVTIRQGKGTFVKINPVLDDLSRLTGVTNILKEKERRATIKVNERKVIRTPFNFERELKRAIGLECVEVERTHILDGTIFGYAKIYIPSEYQEAFTAEALENNTVYEIYQNKLGVKLGKGVQKVYASNATKELAKAMEIETNTPILCIERRAYSESGKLLEYMQLYYEYSQYYFQVELDLSTK